MWGLDVVYYYRVVCGQCKKSKIFRKEMFEPRNDEHEYYPRNILVPPSEYDASQINYPDIKIRECDSCDDEKQERWRKEAEQEKKEENEANRRTCTKCGDDYDIRHTNADICPRCQRKLYETLGSGYTGPSFDEWSP